MDTEAVKDILTRGLEVEVESFREISVQHLGNSVTSVLVAQTIDKREIKAFSKCYDVSRYPQYKGTKDITVSDHSEKIWIMEFEALKSLESYGITPKVYDNILREYRIIMEFLEGKNLKQLFLELSPQISDCLDTINYLKNFEGKSTSDNGIEERLKNETKRVEKLNNRKDELIKLGLRSISKLHYSLEKVLEEGNKEQRFEIFRRDPQYEAKILEDYMLRVILSTNQLDSLAHVKAFFSMKGVDLEGFTRSYVDYLSVKCNGKNIRAIHGDLGPHHIMEGGKIFDLCELRIDIEQYDLVRFLKDHSLNISLKDIPKYVAYFLMYKKIVKGILNDEYYKANPLEIISDEDDALIRVDDWVEYMRTFLAVSIKEDIHLAAVYQRYSNEGNSRIEQSAYCNQLNSSGLKEKLFNYRINSIKSTLDLLLSMEGRDLFLDDQSSKLIMERTNSILQTFGIITEIRHPDLVVYREVIQNL